MEVDARKAGQPYKRQNKGRKDQSGTTAVINLKELSERAQSLIELRIKASQTNKAYNEAVTAVAEACGLNASSVSIYIRARAGKSFLEARDRASQMAFVFEQLGELGDYKAPKQPDFLTNEPEPNPVEKKSNGRPPPARRGRRGNESGVSA